MNFNIGAMVEVKATFTNPETGALVEPGTVTCTVRSPAGAKQIPTVTDTAGVYTAEVEATESGRWGYAFDGRGTYQASGESVFVVNRQEVAR